MTRRGWIAFVLLSIGFTSLIASVIENAFPYANWRALGIGMTMLAVLIVVYQQNRIQP